MRALLRLLSLLVPIDARERWREEWRCEVQHGGWRMLSGALPDAMTLRALGRSGPFYALGQDFRYASRGLLASPGFVLGVVLSLAVGMAVTTAAFSLVNAIAFRPPAGVSKPDRLVQVRLHVWKAGFPYVRSNYEAFARLRGSIHSIAGLAAYDDTELTVGFPDEPLNAAGMLVSSNYFDVLGVRPAAGRLFGAADDGPPGAHPVAVISYDTWLAHFAGVEAVVGSALHVNGTPLEIVGIAPRGFRGIRSDNLEDKGPAVWIPLSMSRLVVRDEKANAAPIEQVPQAPLRFIGRLAAGVSIDAAQVELSVLAAGLDAPNDSLPPTQALVVGIRPRGIVSDVAAFMAVPLIVLALACVNAANLLSSRATRRIRDAAIRLSIGATRWRIVRLMLVESLLLALAGASIGLLFTWWIVAGFDYFVSIRLYIDWRVVTFTLGTSVITAVAFGLAPAIAAAAQADNLVRGLANRRRARARALLIGAQAALSLALIATGGQFAKTVRMLGQNDGLEAGDRVAVASIDVALPWPQHEVDVYYARVLDRVQQLPGVTHAALSCDCDPWGAWTSSGGGSLKIWLPQDPPAKPRNSLAMLSEGDLAGAMELGLVAGRRFEADDHRGPARSVLVNKAFADKYLPSGAVGHTLRVAAPRDDHAASRLTVIAGVVNVPGTKRTDSLPMVYYPSPLEPVSARTLYVRFDREATDLLPLLRAAIREVHPDVPRALIATVEQRQWERQASNRFLATGVSLLGVLALFLSAGGLYGVVSFAVTQRSQEIGIRMALGADATSVVRMIVRQALKPAVFGSISGAFGAVVVGLVVRSRLYGATGIDPLALLSAATVLMAVLLIASALPARRAARIDPIEVLRTE